MEARMARIETLTESLTKTSEQTSKDVKEVGKLVSNLALTSEKRLTILEERDASQQNDINELKRRQMTLFKTLWLSLGSGGAGGAIAYMVKAFL